MCYLLLLQLVLQNKAPTISGLIMLGTIRQGLQVDSLAQRCDPVRGQPCTYNAGGHKQGCDQLSKS